MFVVRSCPCPIFFHWITGRRDFLFFCSCSRITRKVCTRKKNLQEKKLEEVDSSKCISDFSRPPHADQRLKRWLDTFAARRRKFKENFRREISFHAFQEKRQKKWLKIGNVKKFWFVICWCEYFIACTKLWMIFVNEMFLQHKVLLIYSLP